MKVLWISLILALVALIGLVEGNNHTACRQRLKGYYMHAYSCKSEYCCAYIFFAPDDCECLFGVQLSLSIGAVVGTITGGVYFVCIVIGAVLILLRAVVKSPSNYFHPEYKQVY